MNDYRRVVTVQDISCFGQCSITVALPVLSACGVETVILPGALLSTHTGGFHDVYIRDLTEDMRRIAEHWQREGLLFDAVYSGYLGSAEQIGIVREVRKNLTRPGALLVTDPAMADNGRLYSGFDAAFVEKMKGLCAEADILLPNITEACLLTDTPYRETYDAAFASGLARALAEAGAKHVVLTGVSFGEKTTGVLVRTGNEERYYEHRRIAGGCHGTGDAFASAFLGALLRGKDIFGAAGIAAEFVLACITHTAGDPEHRYGAKFETALPELIAMLK